MNQDEFMDRYMQAFSMFTDAQAQGRDPAQVLKEIQGMKGAMSDADIGHLNEAYSAPGVQTPGEINRQFQNTLDTVQTFPGPMSDRELQVLQQMQSRGTLINNWQDFLRNFSRKLGGN
jgi:hypothetical protein